MSRRPIPSVASDLTDVIRHLESLKPIPSTLTPHMAQTAKKIHACTYSLILWRFRLRVAPACAMPFAEEIASDALQVLPQILMGYSKTAKLLIRGIIENTLRFIYFYDHPVEFRIMNAEAKWYVGVDKLFDYMRTHPDFKQTEPRFDAINRAQSVYDELSAGVHGRRVIDLETRNALKQITYESVGAAQGAELIRKCCEASNFLLAIRNRAEMRAFSIEERRIILRTFPKEARETWMDFD